MIVMHDGNFIELSKIMGQIVSIVLGLDVKRTQTVISRVKLT